MISAMVTKDKVLHLALGALWLALIAPAFWLPLGPALAYATTAFAVAYELNQRYRKEGKPEVLDAVCTALPGFVAWAIMEIL